MVHAHGATINARLVHDRKARRLVFMKFPLRLVQSFTCTTSSGDGGPHDIANRDSRRASVGGRHAVANIAFRDDSN